MIDDTVAAVAIARPSSPRAASPRPRRLVTHRGESDWTAVTDALHSSIAALLCVGTESSSPSALVHFTAAAADVQAALIHVERCAADVSASAAAAAAAVTAMEGVCAAVTEALLAPLPHPAAAAHDVHDSLATGGAVGGHHCVLLHLWALTRAAVAAEAAEAPTSTAPVCDSLCPASLAARAAMGRALDLTLWAVTYACSRIAATPASGSQRTNDEPQPWQRLRLHEDRLLHCLDACLSTISPDSDTCVCGTAARLRALQTLDALLCTCRCEWSNTPLTAAAAADEGGGGETVHVMSERAAFFSRLEGRLTSDAVLTRVGGQLKRAVPVLEEIRPSSGASYAVLYDCLRHGVLAGRTASAATTTSVTCAAALAADATRAPHSPLELYSCAVAYLRRSIEFRVAAVDGDGADCRPPPPSSPSPPLAVWRALVCVLERALQEGESALAAPPSPPPLSTASAAPATAFADAPAPYSADVSPCGSPVANEHRCDHEEDDGGGGGGGDQPVLGFPLSAKAAAAGVGGGDGDSIGSAAAAGVRCLPGEAGTALSMDVTVAGLTDVDTLSLAGGGGGGGGGGASSSATQSRPAAVVGSIATSAAAVTATAVDQLVRRPLSSARAATATAAVATTGVCGSSKSSCLQRDRLDCGTAATAATVPVLASTATVLRWRCPSHARLTADVVALLTLLTSAPLRGMASMASVVDAGVLDVLSELLVSPGSTLAAPVTATLENCFVFWETLMARAPEQVVVVEEVEPPSQPTALPPPLRAFMQTFTAFLGWDAERWEVTHALYTNRALRLLIHAVEYAKSGGGGGTAAPPARGARSHTDGRLSSRARCRGAHLAVSLD
ncbi:hypothetical protein NESM_000491600 [Novymonas esmeraldas]|uniref:Uncharacterized protein n=1 Tax=Novymonas esmeraldas TaxID=1808958 RepID=A0AAW0EQZ4_9TRYP